jgi:small subunit ribosomal protein S4
MARRTGPKIRLSRRLGQPLYFTAKEAKILGRRSYAPGQHGQDTGKRLSGYAIQLREKQRAKVIYGLLERQFRKYYTEALTQTGDTGELLLQILERRLDNAVYRMGLAQTRAQARQVVNHGHIQVNGRRVDIPSYRIKTGDQISIRPQSVNKKYFEPVKKTIENHQPPVWMQLDKAALIGKVIDLPKRADLEHQVDPQLIVEFYSR